MCRPQGASGIKVMPGRSAQGALVVREVAPPRLNAVAEHLQLAASNSGQHVAHAVVVADFGVLVVGGRLAGLRGQLAGVGNEVPVVGDEHAAAGGGDDLIAVEGVNAGLPQRARRPLLVGGAQCLGCIFDQGDAKLLAGRQDGSDVGALAIEVDQHHGFGQTSLGCLARQRLRQQRPDPYSTRCARCR